MKWADSDIISWECRRAPLCRRDPQGTQSTSILFSVFSHFKSGTVSQNLLYSSLPLSTSVDSVSLFELAGAPDGSWEHKERCFLLLGFTPASDGSLLFFPLSCHLSFWWLCPHSSALFRLSLLRALVVFRSHHPLPSLYLHLRLCSGQVTPVDRVWTTGGSAALQAPAASAEQQAAAVLSQLVVFCIVGFLHKGPAIMLLTHLSVPQRENSLYTNTAIWKQLAWKQRESSLTDLLKGTAAISCSEMKTPNNPFPKTRQRTWEKCNLHSANVSLPVFSGNLKVNKKSNLNFTRGNKPIKNFIVVDIQIYRDHKRMWK